MAFDGLHIVWTTHNSWQPHDARGNWSALSQLYKQLAQNGQYYEMSAPLHESVPKAASSDTVALTPCEQNEIESHLFQLLSPEGDRIVGGLPVTCCAVNSTAVQLLFAPAPSSHNQIVGRLKSKTASQLLWSPRRKGQKHIWSRGYWFANISGAEVVTRVQRFIYEQHHN